MNSKFCEHFKKLWRTKPTSSVTSESNLIQCLGLFNLFVIGVGAIIGSGIYVMSGFAIRDQAGPSAVLSFLLAAVVVLLIAACYTELASKLHKTGSTYLYIYLTIGEFPAFVTGLSGMIMICLGGAVNARVWSLYLDSLCNGAISNFTMEHIAEWNAGPPISRYPDFVAVILLAFLTLIVALGADFSAKFSAVFVLINIAVLCLVSVCGFIFGDLKNWTGDGMNSFFPFGWRGTIEATAVCFWAYSGFDMISCAVEETRDPKRNVPLATVITMLVVTCLYVSTTAALSLMVPYSSLSTTTPLATVFVDIGQNWGRYVVSVGTLCAFTTSIISTFYSFVRVGLAMAEDGLLFAWFRSVNARTGVPILSAIFCGCVQAAVAFFVNVESLMHLISFSVNLILLSYCAVCASVIIITYRPPRGVGADYRPIGAVDEEFVPASTADEQYLSMKSVNVGYLETDAEPQYSLVTAVDSMSKTDEVEEANTSFRDAVSTEPLLQDADRSDCKQNGSSNLKEEEVNVIWSNANNSNNTSTDDVHTQAVENHDVVSTETRSLLKAFVCLSPFMVFRDGRCALFALGMMSLFMLGLSFCIKYAVQPLEHGSWWSILLFCLVIAGIAVFFVIICVHRQTYKHVILKLHCVPLVPAIAIVMCLILLVTNSTQISWIGFGVLLIFDTLIYVLYSVRHSVLNQDIHLPGSSDHLLSEASDSD